MADFKLFLQWSYLISFWMTLDMNQERKIPQRLCTLVLFRQIFANRLFEMRKPGEMSLFRFLCIWDPCSVDNVVRLSWLRSDNLTFWPKMPKTGQILTKKGPKKSDFWVSSQIFMTLQLRFLVSTKCILKKCNSMILSILW